MYKSISEIEKNEVYGWDEIYALADLFYSKDFDSHLFIESQDRVIRFGKLPNNKLICEKIFDEIK
jgi:hypothetical protein